MEDWGRVVVMLPIAMAASLGMVYVMLGKGWMRKGQRYWWAARIGAGSAAYVLMSYAYPLREPNQVVSAVALVGYWCVYVGVVWWLASRVDGKEAGPQVGAPMQSEVMFEMEGDDDDTAIDDGWVVVPVDAPVPVVMYDDGRRTDSGSAVQVGGRPSSTGGADKARNDVAPSATVPPANRGGRGRRLSGGFVSG